MAIKVLVSDTEESHGNTCKGKIEAECPTATVTLRLESLSSSIDWAIDNGYDIISRSTTGLSDSRNENEGDMAWAGTIGIVHAHGSNSHTELTDPSRLDVICAVAAGDGNGECGTSYGNGLEFFDDEETTESYATARVAGKIAQLMTENPTWSFHDARMALRQTASYYDTGWVADGGYGNIDKSSASAVSELQMFSPTRQEYAIDTLNRQIVFTWKNPKQTDFDEAVICRMESEPQRIETPAKSEIIYNGKDETYIYNYSEFRNDDYLVFMARNASEDYSYVESFDKNEEDVTGYKNRKLLNNVIQSPMVNSSLL